MRGKLRASQAGCKVKHAKLPQRQEGGGVEGGFREIKERGKEKESEAEVKEGKMK